MNHFCTITTGSHLYKVQALEASLAAVNPDFQLHVLCMDITPPAQTKLRCYRPEHVLTIPDASAILAKYRKHKDRMRWSLKPVFMQYLLRQEAIDKVIYLDNDLFFYNDYGFLFDLLDKHTFLLTPHYYPHDPKKDQNWLEANFRVGLFNAGFVAASRKALSSLAWWAACCLYRCEKNPMRGLFDDQKYLDLIPVREPETLILPHKGCNVASWNRTVCPRSMRNGAVYISDTYPIVFIHFNDFCIREILDGKDPLLRTYLNHYIDTLKQFRPGLTSQDLYKKEPLADKIKFLLWKLATDLGL
ncbi:MAG: hypothetical protein KatS3mg031_2612 [Chitinophagales bacterium]|nr:MAG: hypothetical protein KatS3mg031_2612 [Chitinophagales bacterium]